jgi:hypothetical protein
MVEVNSKIAILPRHLNILSWDLSWSSFTYLFIFVQDVMAQVQYVMTQVNGRSPAH